MTSTDLVRRRIGAAFAAAADGYDGAASVQRLVAERLGARILAASWPPTPLVLEIGCGTGFLGATVLPNLPGARWICADLAPAMASHARSALAGLGHAEAVAMDGEMPALAPRGGFDLVCSSLTAQWFQTPAASLGRLAQLVAPGGRLVLATLAEDSFAEWRAAHAALGLDPGTHHYPSLGDIARWLAPFGAVGVDDERVLVPYRSGAAFLEAMRGIGAGTPRPGYRPLTPGALRRVLRGFESGVAATYHVAYATLTRSASSAARPRLVAESVA
jgi:malonyl-CoA O-methyltransferase